MPKGLGKQIDIQQTRISSQIEKENQNLDMEHQILASKNYENIFISQVNEFQTLQKKEQLEQGPEEVKKYFIQGENHINSLLRRAANRGAALYKLAIQTKSQIKKSQIETTTQTKSAKLLQSSILLRLI